MDFFKSKFFIAVAFFLIGMATSWIWTHKEGFHFAWSSSKEAQRWGAPSDHAAFDEIRRMQEDMIRSFGHFETEESGRGEVLAEEPRVLEDEKGYRLEIPLNGQSPKNFSVQVEKGQLFIQGSLEKKEDGAHMISSFSKVFPVPENVDVDQIQIENIPEKIVIRLPLKK